MDQKLLVQLPYFLLRVVSGLLFLQAGGVKMLDWFGGVPAEYGGHPAAWSQAWIGGALELYGGLLVLLGLFTRPVAFLVSGEMAVAYWQFHYKPDVFWPVQNHGEPAVLLRFPARRGLRRRPLEPGRAAVEEAAERELTASAGLQPETGAVDPA